MPTKNIDEHRECYRRCFGTPDGRKVLASLLIDLGWNDPDFESVELKAFATKLLRILGFTDTPGKVLELVGKMYEIPQTEE